MPSQDGGGESSAVYKLAGHVMSKSGGGSSAGIGKQNVSGDSVCLQIVKTVDYP